MIYTKTRFLTTFLFLLLAIPFSVAQINPIVQSVGEEIYHFPPPMDNPSFPFTIVTMEATTPEWAKMLYAPNPNINEIQRLHNIWRKSNPTVKNGHTRNFRKLTKYLAHHEYVNAEGFIDLPTNEESQAKSAKILRDRAKFQKQNQQSIARNSNDTDWELKGPTFMKRTNGIFANEHVNVYSITQCLSNTDVLYCATENGGTVFKTTDNGLNWFSVSDNLITSMGSRNIEVAPSDPNIVYLCTQHDIFKTTVGGNTWTSVYNASNVGNLTLIINPTNPDTVLAGGRKGILKSVDGGATWTNPLSGKLVYDLRYQPGSTSVIYALVDNPTTKKTDFYKSTDAGETWSVRTTGWPSAASTNNSGGQMTTCDAYDHIIYVFIGAAWAGAPANQRIKILKSADYGETWTLKVDYDNAKGINSGQGYYDWDIEMSDVDSNIIALGTQGSWITYDDFATVTSDMRHAWHGHEDIQEMLFNGTEIWVVNDGGITKYENDSLYNYETRSKGINAMSYWGFDQGWNKDVTMGTHYHNGSSATHEDYETNVGVNFGGAEPHFALVAQPNGDRVVSKGYGSVNGYTMPNAQNGTFTRFGYNLTPNNDYVIGNNGATHPLYYNTHYQPRDNKLLKTEDFGLTWDTLYTFPIADDYVWDIRMTRANTQAIFVTTLRDAGANIYRSLDGGQSFTKITPPDFMNVNPKIFNLSVSNEDENTFFLLCNKWGTRVAKTTDGGATWTNLGSNALNGYGGSKTLAVDGTDGGLYLLTNKAIFYRNNTLSDWVALTTGIPANTSNKFIHPFYRDNELRIATSRGIYGAKLYDTPVLKQVLLQPTVQQRMTECNRDTFYFDDYSVVEHTGAAWSWAFPGATYISATNVRNPKVVYGNSGQYDVTMSITKNGQTFTKSIEKMVEVGTACSTIEDVAGKAMSLSGGRDYMTTPALNLTTTELTVSTWVKRTSESVYFNGIFSANTPTGLVALNLGYGPELRYHYPGTNVWNWNSGHTLPLNEWTHVALVIKPTETRIYMNGVPAIHNTSSSLSPMAINSAIHIGAHKGNRRFYGDFDEVAIWKKALTETEVKEWMHLTKNPETDADLLAYYQYNEEEGVVFDKVGNLNGELLNGGQRIVSSAPVGGGFSDTQTEINGTATFTNTDVEVTFTTQNGAEIVASKINTTPYNLNGLIEGDTPLATEYWAIHRFGNGDFTANLSLKTSTDLGNTEQDAPCQLALYGRKNTSDVDWEFIAVASSVDAASDRVTFENIRTFDQYLVTKSTQPIIRATSPVVIKNTAVGAISTESSYTVSGANLTTNLQITVPTGFEISTTSGAGFTNSLSLTPTNNKVAPTTIYVRYTPTESRLYYENISHISSGANHFLVEVRSTGFELDCSPGTAMDFDGNNDYVFVPVDNLDLGDKMTLEFWSDYRGSMSSATSILEALDKDNNRVINMHFPWSNSQIYFDAGNIGGSYDRINKSVSESEMRGWTHWAFVKDAVAGTMEIYRNGVLWHSGIGKTKSFNTITQLYLGRRGGGNYNNSKLDELRLWNTARTASEIRETLHLTAKGSETGLVAYFQFNEVAGNIVDKIGNLSGALSNGAARTAATEPVGCGFSNTQSMPNGSIIFTNTDISAIYNTTTDDVVATKLNVTPNTTAGIGGETAADQQYWVVNHYGGANNKNATLTFTLGEDIMGAESASDIKLYGRNQTSDGDWSFIVGANSIDAVNNTATFESVMTYQQYLITKAAFPKISVDRTNLPFGNVEVNTSSTEASFTVSGVDLTADINLTAPAGFEISLTSGTGFGNNLTVAQSGGTVAATTIYVRFVPTSNGYQSGDIAVTSTGATSHLLRVDGNRVVPEIEIRQAATILASGGTIDFSNLAIGESTSLSFTIKNTDLGTLDLPNSPTITVAGTNANDFVVTKNPANTSLSTNEFTTFEITFAPSSAGAKSAIMSLVNNDGDENPYTLNLTGLGDPIPMITVSNLTDFGNLLVGSTSTEKSYTVSGINLLEVVTLSTTGGYEISLSSGSGFASTLTLNPSNGTLATTTIYVRFAPQGVNTYNGSILHASEKATTQIVTVNGSSSKLAETVPGNAIQFNGSSDYISIPNNSIFQFGASTDFTVAVWMKTTNWQNDASIVSNKDWDSGSRNSWNIALAEDGKGIDINVGDGSKRADLQAGDINNGAWHHIAATFDRDGLVTLYIDGIFEQSISMAHVEDINSGLPLTFGRDSENEYFFDGFVDEGKIWNAALTAQQVREAMHITSEWNSPNLIAYYQFNEPNYGSVYNLKGNAHGSMTGGNRVISTVPVGGGFADTKTESASAISFTNTDVNINFTAQNSAEVVVSKINLSPNIIPIGLTRVFTSQYWAINRYGTGAFAGNITFKVAEDLTTGDQQSPDEILLYGRNFNSDAAWTLVTAATAVDAANDKATFDAITNFDQFLIVSSSDGSTTAPVDCIPDIEYENRNDLPALNSSTTYIKAGNINGSGEVVIENGQNILFRAKDYIQLMPGFTVKAGAEFTAKIEDCSAGIVADAPAQARIAPVVTQSEIKTALDMNVYPNPFETRFFIDYRINKEAQVTIQLFDLSGKKVRDILLKKRRKAGNYKTQFTNKNLAAGTYILVIQIDKEVYQEKVVMSNRK